jgi:hypothetical protein
MQKFSPGELSELRNAISVDILIKDILPIPSKISDGIFHFLCPICNEFQTAINPNVNLARCFRCERNFNTIDLVIEVYGCRFQESVAFLKQLLGQLSNQDKNIKQVSSDHGREVQVCNTID